MSDSNDPMHDDSGGRRLVLFVAGEEPNSRIARANLDRLLAEPDAGDLAIDVVDVLDDHSLAVEHSILVTPALVEITPQSRLLAIGNLTDLDRVRALLGLADRRTKSGVAS